MISFTIHICWNIVLKTQFFCSSLATVFNNANQHINVYGDDIEVDYRGYEVSY